jgi:flagellar basal body-associated protein FliL
MLLLPVLIGIVLGLLALAYILYPIYRANIAPSYVGAPKAAPEQHGKQQQQQTVAQSHSDASLAGREEAARAALHEVELDYQLGNIEEDEYRTLRERYLRRALVAIKSRQEREQELDNAIEEQLRTLKETKAGGSEL